MYRARKILMVLALTMTAGGVCFQFGSCEPLAVIQTGLSSINPCGTILNCDPVAYEFATSGIDGPGVDPDVDPFCTYAPFCSAGDDPIFGGLVNP
jgi:hypothetical protein